MYRLAAQDGKNLERKENHVMTDTKNKEKPIHNWMSSIERGFSI